MSAEPTPNFVLGLKLALMGRDVKTYVLGKPVITVGRDPEADIFLDNPGVSREHLRFERTPAGWYEVVDLGSANGSFLNDEPLTGRKLLRESDHVRAGKFTLTVTYESDRRDSMMGHAAVPDSDQHTMVLTKDELARVRDLQRQAEAEPPEPPPAIARLHEHSTAPAGKSVPFGAAIRFMLAAYAIGAATGAAIAWFLRR